jgi:hypothetical protein
MGIVGEKTFRCNLEIGKVAAPATRYEYLRAGAIGVLKQQYPPAALPCGHCAHQSCRACSKDYDVKRLHRRSNLALRSLLAQAEIMCLTSVVDVDQGKGPNLIPWPKFIDWSYIHTNPDRERS